MLFPSRFVGRRLTIELVRIVALSSLVIASLARPAAAAGEGAEVSFYGTFRSVSAPRPVDEVPPDIRLGDGWTGPRPVRRTDRVPAAQGTLFGILFVPRASAVEQAGTLMLRSIIHFPAIGLVDPRTGARVYGSSRSIQCLSGRPCLAAMGLQADWEVVPGERAIEVQAEDGTPLVVKRFSVVPPAEIEPILPHPAARHPLWAIQATIMCLAVHPETRMGTPIGRKFAESHPDWDWEVVDRSRRARSAADPSISTALCEAVLNEAFEKDGASIPRPVDHRLDDEIVALGPLFDRIERGIDHHGDEISCPSAPSSAK